MNIWLIMPELHSKFLKNMLALSLPAGASCAVACSGGPDSMALALLLRDWAKDSGHPLTAITVDHAMRPESAQEAQQVAQWLEPLGIPHAILRWEGKKPARNIQEEARIARYRLIAEYCQEHSIPYVMTAHTLDDQAETFLLRLARGSGVDGLAAMGPHTELYGLTLLRPLLDIRKTELLAYLEARGQSCITDPSNSNPRYDRVKMRNLLPQLAEAGMTPQRLSATIRAMRRARQFLESETQRFMRDHVKIFNAGYALLARLPESEEIALRVLAELLLCIGGHSLRPRLEDLERLYHMLGEPTFKGATLSGCVFASHKKAILILREQKAVQGLVPLLAKQETLWDNRFIISLPDAPKGLRVGALTQPRWLAISRIHRLCNPFPTKKILYTLPALLDAQNEVLCVPHLHLWQNGVPLGTVVFRQRPGMKYELV